MKTRTKRKKSAVRRLLTANLIALGVFLVTLTLTLWALGLLPSILAFLF